MSGAVRAVVSAAVVGVVLVVGVYLTALVEEVIRSRTAHRPLRRRAVVATPLRRAATLVVQSRTTTERPDWQAWALAPALLVALAAVMLVVVPVAPGVAVADVPHGLILFGAAAALVIIPAFLEGWSPNSLLALVGGYRMFAQALSYMIPLALVLIGAALPAESLRFGALVVDQHGLWNVIRMPLGLPVYLAAVTGLAFYGPLALPAAPDLAGGIDLEASSLHLLAWRAGQRGVLVGAAAVGATAFLGGWQGPWLPAPVWVAVKTLALVAALVWMRERLARIRPERFVVWAWTILLPAALVDIFVTGGWLLL